MHSRKKKSSVRTGANPSVTVQLKSGERKSATSEQGITTVADSIGVLLTTWGREFSARSDRIRMLIGDAHWLSDGTHKEMLVREFLARRLPTRLTVETGFLLSAELQSCSRQIDVFVRDTVHSAPFFSEAGVTICDPRAVVAALEIKSALSASSLKDGLNQVADLATFTAHADHPGRVWRGICFTSGGKYKNDIAIVHAIDAQVKSLLIAKRKTCSDPASLLPTCIFSADQFCCFVSYGQNAARCRLRYFPMGEASFAAAFVDLLSHSYAHLGVASRQPIEEFLRSPRVPTPITVEI